MVFEDAIDALVLRFAKWMGPCHNGLEATRADKDGDKDPIPGNREVQERRAVFKVLRSLVRWN